MCACKTERERAFVKYRKRERKIKECERERPRKTSFKVASSFWSLRKQQNFKVRYLLTQSNSTPALSLSLSLSLSLTHSLRFL